MGLSFRMIFVRHHLGNALIHEGLSIHSTPALIPDLGRFGTDEITPCFLLLPVEGHFVCYLSWMTPIFGSRSFKALPIGRITSAMSEGISVSP